MTTSCRSCQPPPPPCPQASPSPLGGRALTCWCGTNCTSTSVYFGTGVEKVASRPYTGCQGQLVGRPRNGCSSCESPATQKLSAQCGRRGSALCNLFGSYYHIYVPIYCTYTCNIYHIPSHMCAPYVHYTITHMWQPYQQHETGTSYAHICDNVKNTSPNMTAYMCLYVLDSFTG